MATYHPQSEPRPSVLTGAHTGYALHPFAIGVGLVDAAPVIGSFVGSVPSLLAVFLNSATRSDAMIPGSRRTTAGRFARVGSLYCGRPSAGG